MSTLLILVEHDGWTFASACRVRLRDRLWVRIRAVALDRALGQGAPPESSPWLALRAQQLLEPALRTGLAAQIERVLDEARRARRRVHEPVPLPSDAICELGPALQRLAARLIDDGPIAVRGVAFVQTLLYGGGAALYRDAVDRSRLERTLGSAFEALEQYL